MSTDINLTEDKYILVYQGNSFLSAHFATNKVSSNDTVEIFDTAQELFDRAFALGLRCKTKHLLAAMEHGAVLPQVVMDELFSYIWDMGPIWEQRMSALGYEKPEPEEIIE